MPYNLGCLAGMADQQLAGGERHRRQADFADQAVPKMAIRLIAAADGEIERAAVIAGDAVRRAGRLQLGIRLRKVLHVKRNAGRRLEADVDRCRQVVRLVQLGMQIRHHHLVPCSAANRIAHHLQHQVARSETRFFASHAKGPAGVQRIAIPLRGDRAHGRVFVQRTKQDRRFHGKIAVRQRFIVGQVQTIHSSSRL